MIRLHPDFLHTPIAHRGLHNLANGSIENSLDAFEAAIRAGYGIELDVQLSSDDRAISFHDYDLARLTPRADKVRALSAKVLSGVAFNNSAATIPTLADAVDLVDGKVPLLVEIKDQSLCYSDNDIGALEAAVARDLWGYAGPVAVMSFNPHSVRAFGKVAPNIARGLTTGGFGEAERKLMSDRAFADLVEIASFDDVGASFISHYVDELKASRVAELRAKDLPVLTWTVRDSQQEAEARRYADNITFEGYTA